MHTTRRHTTNADLLEAAFPDLRCCDGIPRCGDCQAMVDEARAARRDALIHALRREATPRRSGWAPPARVPQQRRRSS